MTKQKDKAPGVTDDQAQTADATAELESARAEVDPAFLALRDLVAHLCHLNPTAHTLNLLHQVDVQLGLESDDAEADAEAGK